MVKNTNKVATFVQDLQDPVPVATSCENIGTYGCANTRHVHDEFQMGQLLADGSNHWQSLTMFWHSYTCLDSYWQVPLRNLAPVQTETMHQFLDIAFCL